MKNLKRRFLPLLAMVLLLCGAMFAMPSRDWAKIE